MAADGGRLTLVVVVLWWVLSSCTSLHGDRYGVAQTQDGLIEFITCSESLPAMASVWRVGPNQIVGDGDDEVVWGPTDMWGEGAGASVSVATMVTSVDWAAGLFVSIDASASPTQELPPSLAVGLVLGLDGEVGTRDEFTRECGN